MTRFAIALMLLLSVASAKAVLRSPFPRKPSPPYSGTIVVVDELKRSK
jgi:hypothetical protein